MTYNEFYTEFARLLLSISSETHAKKKEGISHFRAAVKQQLIKLEGSRDDFNLGDEMYTEFELEEMAEEHHNMQEAFKSFSNFIQNNSKSINQQLKVLIRDSVVKVAEANPDLMPEEKKLVASLKRKLAKI
ncbi:MAG: hypothetical protein KKA07_05750 [Bacteroidetes bacterium]|nr:hypothetical protein [Bacteroidota bacterium]MBU1718558.1 hypothetical protein [Bacteroidota bacterium]